MFHGPRLGRVSGQLRPSRWTSSTSGVVIHFRRAIPQRIGEAAGKAPSPLPSSRRKRRASRVAHLFRSTGARAPPLAVVRPTVRCQHRFLVAEMALEMGWKA
jgi:hypothetical protein